MSASGYHQHRTRSEAPDQPGRIHDMALLVHIRAVFAEMKGAYGWPRIWRELTARGILVGKERVRKLMKANGLQARGKRKFKATTNSNHTLPVSPDLLDLLERNFSTPEPNRVWTGDITYVRTEEGWLYLAVVIDLFSPQVVGFAMHERMTRQLVIDALRMAWFRRRPASGLIFNSDRGSQYASIHYTERLAEAGIEASVGSVGDSYDCALAETINGLYKAEVIHRRGPWRSFEAVEFATLEWVDWFNNRRLLGPIGNIPPAEAKERYYAMLDEQKLVA